MSSRDNAIAPFTAADEAGPLVRLARWSMDHRRAIVVAWLAALVAAGAAMQAAGDRFVNSVSLPGTESQRATDLLRSRFPAQAGDSDQIVFHARRGTLADPAVRAVVLPALGRIARLPHVVGVVSPYAGGSRSVSRDGTIGLATVAFDERGDALPTAAIERVIRTAEAVRSPRLQVELGGNAIEQTQRPSLGAATAIGIAAAAVVLLVSFGSLLAAGLPIVTALLALGIGGGLIALGTHLLDTPDFARQLAFLIGLGVGVDYALLVVSRYRDAYRANGGDVRAAVEEAMHTAGRSIAFAGITVVIAMLGLLAVGVSLLDAVALATSLTVLLVLAASLTLLPALLSRAGRRVGEARAPRRVSARRGPGLWPRWIALVQRRPAAAALAASALLLLLAAPALGLRLAWSDAGNDGPGTTTRRAYDLVARGFGSGYNGPLLVAVRLPAPGATGGLARLTAALRDAPGVAAVGRPRLSPARDTAAVTVFPASAPESSRTYSLVHRLRDRVLPPVAAATGTSVLVGGYTATQVDFAHVLSGKLPVFVGIVVALSALLLAVVFRSLLIPLQAALMNLLSIAAALGVVQAVFERGWLAGQLGVRQAPIEPFIPVIVFAIVFGLSMDYEVFLVSRVHEEWQRRGDSSAAVRHGLLRTGRVITAAAAVMVVVFASFAASSEHVLALFGLALASAVFLDALVIRTILLPAVLELLGRATWRFPAVLDRRLPRVALEPTRERPTVVEAEPASEAA